MPIVSFHPAARLEVEDAQAWYEERSVVAASALLRELSVTVQRIREAPHRYATAESGTRRIRLDRFPFTIYIYYRHSPDALVVIAVAHQKRRPGYWSSQ